MKLRASKPEDKTVGAISKMICWGLERKVRRECIQEKKKKILVWMEPWGTLSHTNKVNEENHEKKISGLKSRRKPRKVCTLTLKTLSYSIIILLKLSGRRSLKMALLLGTLCISVNHKPQRSTLTFKFMIS